MKKTIRSIRRGILMGFRRNKRLRSNRECRRMILVILLYQKRVCRIAIRRADKRMLLRNKIHSIHRIRVDRGVDEIVM